MKRNVLIIFAVLLLLLLAGCQPSGGTDDEAVSRDEPHTYAGYPLVYFTTDVSSKGLLAVYDALEAPAAEGTAMKLSERTGTFQWSELTEDLILAVGEPAAANYGSELDYSNYDNILVLTHFHRHETLGFYGTIMNLASFSGLPEKNSSQTGNADEWMKELAELGNAAAETLKGQVLYIAVLDHFSIGDASSDAAIFSSYDPVSLDQACLDYINMTEEGQSFALHIADCGGLSALIHAEQMGLGSRTYALLNIGL